MVSEYFANFFSWIWLEAANHLWQSTLFFFLAVTSVAALRNSPAKARYTVWLVASAKFALPLSVFFAFGQWFDVGRFLPHTATIQPQLYNSTKLVEAASFNEISPAASVIETVPTYNEIYFVLTMVWLLGCFGLFALWRKRSRLFKAQLANRSQPATPRELESLKYAQAQVGLTSRVNLIISDSISEPIASGVWKPTIVIPRGLSQKLTRAEFESILIHELSHIANKDNLIYILQTTLCCLLWFHPLVWLIKRRILEERERVCDETVIKYGSQSRIYATGLLKVVRFGLHSHQSPGLASATGANLTKRLEAIMTNKINNTKTLWQKWIVGTMFTALLLVSLAAIFVTTQVSGGNSRKEPFAELTVAEQLNVKTLSSAAITFKDKTTKDAPLVISEATFRAMPVDEYRNSIKNTLADGYRINVVDGKVYAAFITVRNTTNLPIRQIHLVIPSVGNIVVKLGGHEIKPGASRLLENLAMTETWEPQIVERIISNGDAVTIRGVKFADDSGWGSLSSKGQEAGEEKMYGIMVEPLGE